ncbi:MAG: DUF4142 domain-containing protein [Janthinobacterium lividum]
MTDFTDETNSETSRRAFLSRLAAAGLGAAALGMVASAQAATKPQQPAADTGHDYPMSAPHAMTAKQFYKGVIPIAVLSRAASGMAVDKATDPATKEFANFELREAIAVLEVLKEMGTPTPPMDAHAKATLATLKSTEGTAFDKAYITAELGAHEFLRDLSETYLSHSQGQSGMAEMHGRHISTLALALFKEHIVHCKNIKAALAS